MSEKKKVPAHRAILDESNRIMDRVKEAVQEGDLIKRNQALSQFGSQLAVARTMKIPTAAEQKFVGQMLQYAHNAQELAHQDEETFTEVYGTFEEIQKDFRAG